MKENISGKEQLDFWTIKDYIRNLFMLGMKIPIWILQKFLFFIPLKPNRMIIYSLKQSGYSCNLKYLTEYINRHCKEDFELLWVVKNEVELRRLQSHQIPTVTLHSWKHYIYRLRCGIVITNDEFYPVFLKRKNQIYVNTWHGGINYKQIGYSGLGFTNSIQKLIYRLNNPQPDIFVSGSRAFTESTAMAFGFSKAIFLPCGLPRNDILFNYTVMQREKIKRTLNIPIEDKLLLYAPTFRKGKVEPQITLNYRKLESVLNKKWGGKWKFLIRQHYFVTAEGHKTTVPNNVIDVTDYEDIQELILCSDCMISDYSSCMWDFSFTKRPCLVYAADFQEYFLHDRSFSISPTEWPYPLCQNEEELYAAISEFDIEVYQQKIELHHICMEAYETGNACKLLINEIQKRVKGLELK